MKWSITKALLSDSLLTVTRQLRRPQNEALLFFYENYFEIIFCFRSTKVLML